MAAASRGSYSGGGASRGGCSEWRWRRKKKIISWIFSKIIINKKRGYLKMIASFSYNNSLTFYSTGISEALISLTLTYLPSLFSNRTI